MSGEKSLEHQNLDKGYEILRKQSVMMKEKLFKIEAQLNSSSMVVDSDNQGKLDDTYGQIDEVSEESIEKEELQPTNSPKAWDQFDQLETSSEKVEEDSEISVQSVVRCPSMAQCFSYQEAEQIHIQPSDVSKKLIGYKPICRIMAERKESSWINTGYVMFELWISKSIY